MLGAIIGDIVGSVYEFHNIKSKEFPLFGKGCRFTDDTVMTVATADALMHGGEADDFIDAYKKWGRRYPDAGYGARFTQWLQSDTREPYNSYGNGSAMRISPVGFYVESSWDLTLTACNVNYYATFSAEVTHNHPEGIKGAQAVADAIMFMRYAEKKGIPARRQELKSFISEKHGYNLTKTLDEIRPGYRFTESCQDSVPQAITAFLESKDFEDAIRNAISIGGDSDTIAAITGGIAEAAYGLPKWIADKAWAYLDEPLKDVCRQWRKLMKLNAGIRKSDPIQISLSDQ